MNAQIPLRAWADLLLLALLWGAGFLFIALALREVPPLWVVTIRVSFAAILLWLYVLLRGLPVPRAPNFWFAVLVMGLLNNVTPFVLITWGQLRVESGLTSILNGSTAFFGILVASIFLKDERLTARRLAGVALGIGGIAAIVGPEAFAEFDLRALGQLAILGGTLSYAFASVWARLRLAEYAPAVSAAGMLTGASLTILPLSGFVEGAPTLPTQPLTWLSLVYIAALGTAGAFLLYYRILAAAGAGNLMLVTIIMPPISVGLGALILGERLAPGVFIGAALILLGLIVIDGRALAALARLARRGREA